MRQFDFYEFAGVLAPGAVFLTGLAVLFRATAETLVGADFGAGDLGLFTILAYVAGQLIQAAGNALEWAWWKVWGGWPTEWPKSAKGHLLSAPQTEQLRVRLRSLLEMPAEGDPFVIPAPDWMAVTRQVDAAVQAAGRSGRVEKFNANYGLNRGIAASLAVITLVALLMHGLCAWRLLLLPAVATGVAMYRMHRCGRHYARELFVQFLELPACGGGGTR